jgi:hypothetical protein
MTRSAFLVFSGYNPRAVVAFCRVASRCKVPFCIVASSASDPILQTEYRKNVHAVRRSKLLEIQDVDVCLLATRVATGYDDLVVLPSSEFLIRFFLTHRAYYRQQHCRIPLVDEEAYRLVSDKLSFATHCRNFGVPVPEEYPSFEGLEYPFVAKPKRYFSTHTAKSLVPYLILNEADWAAFAKNERPEDFFYQEYVTGESYYLLFHFASNGETLCYSQENLVQQAEGKSMILCKSSDVHTQPIAEAYARLLRALGFHGLIMIELRKRGSDYLMIEANPRLWGPSQLFVDAGVPLFEAFIQDQGFALPQGPATDVREAYYFWYGGMVQDRLKGKSLAFHRFNPDDLYEHLDDFLTAEVYLRPDTEVLFFNESKGIC